MLSPSRWRFTSQRFDKPQASVDKHKDKNTAAFVPLLCRILMQICEIIVASDVWMRRTITLQNNTVHHGRGTFIMAFEPCNFLQYALSRQTRQLGYVANRWARKSHQARFESSRCLHHGASEETTLANAGILRWKPTPAEFPLFFQKVSLPAGLEPMACTNTRALTAWVLFLMHK